MLLSSGNVEERTLPATEVPYEALVVLVEHERADPLHARCRSSSSRVRVERAQKQREFRKKIAACTQRAYFTRFVGHFDSSLRLFLKKPSSIYPFVRQRWMICDVISDFRRFLSISNESTKHEQREDKNLRISFIYFRSFVLVRDEK